MGTRVVRDTIHKPNGTPHASVTVWFTRRAGSFSTNASTTGGDNAGKVSAVTDADGNYSITLVVGEYAVAYPGDVFIVTVPEGDTPILMRTLRAGLLADPPSLTLDFSLPANSGYAALLPF